MSVKIGILGFAHGHVNAYCQNWNGHPEWGVTVAVGWDHDRKRAERAAKDLGPFDVADTAEDLLARPDLDGVVIASETALHADLAVAAAGAGKAIALQKPAALTLPEADRIVAAVDEHGVPFTMAWQMRVDPQNLRMRKLLRDGVLGRVFMIRRRHGLSVCLNDAFADSWHVSPKWNRDIWADDASHPIDFIYWLFGLPETVTAEVVSLHNPKMPMDNGIAVFRYPDGPLAEVCCSFTNAAGENTTEVIGEHGSIVQNYGDVPSCNVPRPAHATGLKWFLREAGNWTFSDLPTPPGHGHRIGALAEPLAEFFQGRRPPIATAAEGRDVLRMTLACYVATREGRRVSLDDPGIAEV